MSAHSDAVNHSGHGASAPPEDGPAISIRSVALGLLLIPPNAYWLAVVEVVRATDAPTELSLFSNAVFTLVLVVLVNGLIGRVAPRLALSRREVAVTYILCTLGCAMGSLDMYACLPPMMAFPAQYASPENDWEQQLLPLLPEALYIPQRELAAGYWQGGQSVYEPRLLAAWLPRLGYWMVFGLGLSLLWLAMTAIFSPRWIRSERLTYPIAQLPAALAYRPRRLVEDPALLLAAGVATFIALLNGIHHFQPIWPYLPVKAGMVPQTNVGAQLVDPPWNAVGTLTLSFYPFAIGLGLLLPARLSLSCWVFYLLFKLQHVVVNQAGSWTMEGFPYTRQQSLGSFLGLVAFSLYMSRRHIARFAAEALGRQEPADEDRPLAPRTALLLLVGSFAFLVGFSSWAGMTIPYAVAFFTLYAALCLSFTRVRAEMGVPTHELHLVGPGESFFRWFGSERIGGRNLAVAALYYWFNRAYRGHPMPHLAEGFKMCDQGHIAQSKLVPWAVLAMLIGGFSTAWTLVHVLYVDGANTKWGVMRHSEWIAIVPYQELALTLEQPTGPNTGSIFATVVGFVVTIVTMALNTYVSWWPLHPVGYAVSNAHAMNKMWFSIFVAWCIKAALIRYGGSSGARRVQSIAFGLILGDYVAGSLWSIYGLARNLRAYSVWI